MEASSEIERLEEENTRLRSAAEQALAAADSMVGYVPAMDQAMFRETIGSIAELMENRTEE